MSEEVPDDPSEEIEGKEKEKEKEKKKSDLVPRLITALVALPLLVVLIAFAPHWGFFLFILLAGSIAMWEFCGILYGDDHRPGQIVTVVLGLGLMTVLYFFPDHFLPGLAATTLAIFLYFLFFYRDQEKVTLQIGGSITGILYGGILFTFIPMLGRDAGEAGWMWIIMTLNLVWSSDTGAYFAGSYFGKRKLYPAVSPNKSVEGAIGGLLTTIAFAFGANALFAHFFPDTWTVLTPLQIFLLAIPANVLGQSGDLAESLFKRAHSVKDSGTIIYGHGGILDRIDALFFAAPWVYYFYIYGV
jgi:phosphatidate cytidylyltransferase